jgi:high-affinity iron transporter
MHELNEAGIVPSIVEHVWDMNRFLSEDSAVGIILQTLLGFNANPSLMEVIAYAGYFLFLGVLFRLSALPARRSVRVKETIETSPK